MPILASEEIYKALVEDEGLPKDIAVKLAMADVIGLNIQEGLKEIASAIRNTDYPLFGETFSGVSSSLDGVADALKDIAANAS